MIVDNAIYVGGRRAAEPASLEETYEVCREQHGLAWIGLYELTEEEFSSVAEMRQGRVYPPRAPLDWSDTAGDWALAT